MPEFWPSPLVVDDVVMDFSRLRAETKSFVEVVSFHPEAVDADIVEVTEHQKLIPS